MKFIFILLLICSCSGSGGNGSSNPSNVPPDQSIDLIPPVIILDPESLVLELSSEEVTNKNQVSIFGTTSVKDITLKLYNDNSCENEIAQVELNSLSFSFNIPLLNNVNNKIYVSAFKNNSSLIDCTLKREIIQDNIAPDSPVSFYFFSQPNYSISSSFLTGGEASDLVSNVKKIRYYYLPQFDSMPVLIKEVDPGEYTSKNVELPLQLGETNIFKFSVVDHAGNESILSVSPKIINQTTPSSVSSPILDYEVGALNNAHINYNNIVLKGLVSTQVDSVSIYRDPDQTIFVGEVTADVFINNGIIVSLNNNVLNSFYIVAKNGQIRSEPLVFRITHDSISPNPPILDSDVYSEYIYELSESVADISGSIESEVVEVIVYSNSSLNLPYSYSNITNLRFNVYPPFIDYGTNVFYMVAVDKAGNKSIPISVSFEYLNYDEP